MIRRMLIAAVLVTAGVVPLFAASPANATPVCKAGYTCYTAYYSTPARTTQIGYTDVPCSGPAVTWGKTSAYFTFSEAECNG
jgi:hypothetical protein